MYKIQIDIRRRSYAKTWGERLSVFNEYSQDTDVHGYKFLVEPNRLVFERIVWLIVLLTFMFGMLYAISSSLINFYNAPTAISEVPTMRSISEIPFPAVSVCPINRFSKTKVSNFTNFM